MKMEKKMYKASDILICTCSNSILLAAGSTCDLCMGLVTDFNTVDIDAETITDRFDERYFEALERWYEDMEFAA